MLAFVRRFGLVSSVVFVALLAGCRSGSKLPAAGSKGYRTYAGAFYAGLAALQVGDDVRAETSLLEATTLVPGEPAGWVNWGILALRQRSFDAAAQRFSKAKQLAPPSDAIDYLQGVLESNRGDSAAAIAALREAIKVNPRNLRAMYLLSSELERQGAADNGAGSEEMIEQILKAQPNNVAALVELSRIAAKRGDVPALHDAVSRLAAHESGWPEEAKGQFQSLQAAAQGDPRSAATRSTFLRNVLMRDPAFRADLSEIKPQAGEEAQPVERFFLMANLPSRPAAPDVGMSFEAKEVGGLDGGPWSWAGAISLNGTDAPVVGAANGRELRLTSGAHLPFPGGAASTPPRPEGVLAFDYNYDFKTDLLFAGAGGVRLFRQESPASFTDVTSSTKLPKSVADAAYTGAWAVDIEADGDLDVVLGSESGPGLVLRNNGDGTFATIQPFADIAGIRQFVWVDLNGDGNPDAALIDGSGRLRVFLNERSARFQETALPEGLRDVRAVTAGDLGGGGPLSLILAMANGDLTSVHTAYAGDRWEVKVIAHVAESPAATSQLRLLAADFDNNGAVDLLLTGSDGTAAGAATGVLLLQDEGGAFHALPQSSALRGAFGAADLRGGGRLDAIGISGGGKVYAGENRGTKSYHWQTIRPRARVATGDQRVNSFGVGGEIEVRAGLLVQKQPITGPQLHFGLGEQTSADVARIMWPNGSVRAEFSLKGDQQIVTEQRLKGSCPFLFAWNGSRMEFVKDSVPWGSAIGLRINSLGTARVEATEEWYKIGRDELKARDGFYDLRVTGELWESYYYDHLALMAVDHPVGTEIFTDERFRCAAGEAGGDRGGRAAADRASDGRQRAGCDGHAGGARWAVSRYVWAGTVPGCYAGSLRGDRPWREGPGGRAALVDCEGLAPSFGLLDQHCDEPGDARGTSMVEPGGRRTGRAGGRSLVRILVFRPGGRRSASLILQGCLCRGLRDVCGCGPTWRSTGIRSSGRAGCHRQSCGLRRSILRWLTCTTGASRWLSRRMLRRRRSRTTTTFPGRRRRWRDLAGYYTRFGDVRELLKKTDDRYVIMNAGDELALRFPAPPEPPAGWVRDFVIAGDGWIKDGDYNSTYSATVLPYPYHARKLYDAAPAGLEEDWVYRHHREDWQTYHTRYVTPERFESALEGVGGR